MSNTLKTLVIGTSLSDASDDIVLTGAAVARSMGAVPWLVHVHSRPSSPSELFGAMDGTWIEEHMQLLRERLAEQAQRTGLTGLPGFGPGQLQPAMGSTYEEIVALARRTRADLIVIGAAEDRALRRTLLGSTADGVIRQAPCPVLVVRSASGFPPARVEIGVDLSQLSAHALRQGLDFLSRVGAERAEKEVLYVLDPVDAAFSRHVRRSALDGLHLFLEANGVSPYLARIRTGYPWKEILTAVKEKQADLVILGTHGRRGFEKLMLGSVATAMMHHAHCNLLIVPPGAGLQQETPTPREEALAEASALTGPDQAGRRSVPSDRDMNSR